MPTYKYKAINEMGRNIGGVIFAENEVDLETRLKQVGLDLVDWKETKEKKVSKRGRIKLQDMIVFCLHLEQLNRAGVPLLEAIADVRDATESPRLRDVMTTVYESIKSGEILSKAMARHPEVFNEVFVGLIAAGEKTGDLSESLVHLADHLKWTAEIRRKIRKATSYPIALTIMMLGVISVMMLYVVPKLIEFILAQGFDIPIHTKALIFVSNFFVDYWYLVFSVPIVCAVIFFMLYKTSESFAYSVDGFMLKVPVIGNAVRKINMARFTHFFAVMFNSGVDILESLDSARGVVGNRVLQESIGVVRRTVSEGSTLTTALRMSNQFPNLVVRMFKVGEDSGNMNEALENINFFYTREVNDAVDAMVGTLQPTLIIVLGGIMLWIILAVFGPLYQSFEKLNF